jgi:hypothetical protein
MPTLCIQCTLRAIVDGTVPPVFDETPQEHAARLHADPDATQRERRDLEQRAAARIAALTSGHESGNRGQ